MRRNFLRKQILRRERYNLGDTSGEWTPDSTGQLRQHTGRIDSAASATGVVVSVVPPSVTLARVSAANSCTNDAESYVDGINAFDLESILAHQMGHRFGLPHSAVWRAMMFPFSSPPGQYLGVRPSTQAPDGPLADQDRTGIRVLYPDPNDAVNVGTIQGIILPANPFALADLPAPSKGSAVTGIFGTHVVAVDAATGSVIAGRHWEDGVATRRIRLRDLTGASSSDDCRSATATRFTRSC